MANNSVEYKIRRLTVNQAKILLRLIEGGDIYQENTTGGTLRGLHFFAEPIGRMNGTRHLRWKLLPGILEEVLTHEALLRRIIEE